MCVTEVYVSQTVPVTEKPSRLRFLTRRSDRLAMMLAVIMLRSRFRVYPESHRQTTVPSQQLSCDQIVRRRIRVRRFGRDQPRSCFEH